MVYHDRFDKIIKQNTTMGLPMTPATWIGQDYVPVTRIEIGGHYIVAERIDLENIQPGQMLTVTDVDGRVRRLNTSYIVEAENLVMYKTGIDAKNPHYEYGYHFYRILCLEGVEIERRNEYGEFK